jgi:hypothetical protein
MTFQAPLAAIAAAALLATGPLAQQRPSTSSPQATSKPAVVSLIGCVERVTATPPARGTAQPTPEVPAYKLIDVQPGAGTTTTLKADSQFLLAVSNTLTTPINLGKFQNQRVEVTGTIAPAPPATVNPQPPARPAVETAPLPTFTASSLKVVSTECK